MLVVHPSMWPKLIMRTMYAVISPKFIRKLIWIDCIAQLARYVPMNSLVIPEHILLYDETIHTTEALVNQHFGVEPSILMSKKPTNAELKQPSFQPEKSPLLYINLEKLINTPRIVSDCCKYIQKYGTFYLI